ncbi:MAG TPA: hypothetical protein VLR70_07185, partial [Arthrobacter sp.]|nr:hypothetical protein [Arthrobacter sp.]
MKTPKYHLTVRAVAAAALVLAGSFQAVPALAEAGGPEPVSAASPAVPAATTAPVASTTAGGAAVPATAPPVAPDITTAGGAQAPATAPAVAPAAAPPAISDAGLAEAVRRDLGMTLEEFNAAGQLGRTAADALPSLQELPGYLGIRLRDGQILLEGSGAELTARVDELNGSGSAGVFVLEPPAADSSITPAVDPSSPPADAPSAGSSAAPSVAPSAADLVASSTEQLFQA